DDLLWREGLIGAVKVFVAVCAGEIVDEDPADGDDPGAASVPETGIADQLDASGFSTVPADGAAPAFALFDALPGRQLLLAAQAMPPPHPLGFGLGRVVQPRVGMQAADQGHVPAMAMTKLR